MGTCPGEGDLSTVPPRKGAELGLAGGLLLFHINKHID